MTLSGFLQNNVPLRPAYSGSELSVSLLYFLVGSEVKLSLSDGSWMQGILSYEAGDVYSNPFGGVVRLLKSNGQLMARVDVTKINVVQIINPGSKYKDAWVAQYNLNYPQLPGGVAPTGTTPPFLAGLSGNKIIWIGFGFIALLIIISIAKGDFK